MPLLNFVSQAEIFSIPFLDTIPIHPPNGTPPPPPGELLEDVKMAESNEVNGSSAPHVNGQEDIVMAEDNVTPSATPGISQDFSMASIDAASTSATRSYPDDSDDREPPAKRARTHTDADIASTAHSASPPPPSASPAPTAPSMMPPATASSSSTTYTPVSGDDFPLAQWRFCLSTVKNLKKQKDSGPFQLPVDPVALNIPHYPSIIKTPMDLATVERKLHSSNYQKPDTNPNNPRYYNVQEFITDVHLIFSNALTFNGPDHVVTGMGKRLREIFDKQIKNIPAVEAPPKPVVKKPATPPPPPPPAPVVPPKKAPVARRPSTSVPVIRRSEAEPVGRPKREIHPPPPKDLPYADAPKKHRKGRKVKDDGTAEQLKFCAKLLADLHRKQHWGFANPFYEPVDWQKLDLPTYPKIVRKPMDLSTIRRKLEGGEYPSSQDFYNDFKLMIRNCFLFNPAGTPVNLAGQDLQRLFDEKWRSLPQPRESEDEEEEEEDSEEEERQRKIAALERKKSEIEAEIHALKNPPPKEKKKKEKKEKPPVASTSKAPKQPKTTSSSKKKTKKTVADDDVLSFEQKKDLSEAIGKLDGQRLERVIQIIHEGVPEIRDSTEEIELEIDLLPATVLTKLYNYVLRPLRQPAQPKRSRQGKGTGTGGLKRKSMDEEKEAEKIRQLEERMALFENGGVAPTARPDDSDRSSDSSSGSDSSGSDSE
ncbi:Bromodomain-containing protein [Crepidotus variabilis]|uniref:Bromodomain-containing protein n=1 Tax=Crepidotus variabilis TaxID=179855 RepID=A0A9P6EUL3_9AGAR|nr:Bromodomain-containing protein [Crepidotus variabilis]